MARRFVASSGVAKTPAAYPFVYKTTETFKAGACVKWGTGGDVGTIVECAADPTGVLGVALATVDTNPGYKIGQLDVGGTTVITGRSGTVMVALAGSGNKFTGRLVNGGTDPVTPAQSDVGVQYGVIKDSAGIWAVDQAEVTTKVVEVIAVDITNKFVTFVFLAAVQQEGV